VSPHLPSSEYTSTNWPVWVSVLYKPIILVAAVVVVIIIIVWWRDLFRGRLQLPVGWVCPCGRNVLGGDV